MIVKFALGRMTVAESIHQIDDTERQRSRENRLERLACASNAHQLVKTALPSLLPAQLAQVAERCEQMPRKYRQCYVRAMRGKSMKAAIRAQCHECLGWETPPAECSAPACSLYHYRPGA